MTSMMPKPAATTTGRHANSQLISHPTYYHATIVKRTDRLHSVHFPRSGLRQGLAFAQPIIFCQKIIPFYLDSDTILGRS